MVSRTCFLSSLTSLMKDALGPTRTCTVLKLVRILLCECFTFWLSFIVLLAIIILLPLSESTCICRCNSPSGVILYFSNIYFLFQGEIRVNEQLVLTVMHTLMAREHNRVANGLAEVNPHWDDETLFQEARRINIAEIQHITYNEFLPILLGKDVMEKFGLVLEKQVYFFFIIRKKTIFLKIPTNYGYKKRFLNKLCKISIQLCKFLIDRCWSSIRVM